MDSELEKRIVQADRGKKIFEQIFEQDELSLEDTFLLVLTENEECICYGIKYLPDFIKLYHRKMVYVLMEDTGYVKMFSELGVDVKICKKEELLSMAMYLNLFHDKESRDTRIIFLTEKDGYGAAVGEFIKRKMFSLEEYIAISLYQLII